MRREDAVAQIQKQAGEFGWLVIDHPEDGTVQLFTPMGGATSITAIRQVLRGARRGRARKRRRAKGGGR